MWLSQEKASEYLGKSKSWLKQKQACGIFQEGLHYFKRGKCIFYNPTELDKWVLGIYERKDDGNDLHEQRETLSQYTDKWKTD